MSPERAVDIADVMVNAHRGICLIGPCKKMLAAPELFSAFKGKLKKQRVSGHWPEEHIRGDLFFMGVPVVECESLEGLEYALVRSIDPEERG